jgi:hypothetical protein
MKRIMLTFEPLHPRCIADASEITPRCPLHHVQKVLIFRYLESSQIGIFRLIMVGPNSFFFQKKCDFLHNSKKSSTFAANKDKSNAKNSSAYIVLAGCHGYHDDHGDGNMAGGFRRQSDHGKSQMAAVPANDRHIFVTSADMRPVMGKK